MRVKLGFHRSIQSVHRLKMKNPIRAGASDDWTRRRSRPNTRRASFAVNNAHVRRRRRRTAQNMSNWADDSGDLPPLSVPEAAPVPTPKPAPAPASSSGASAPAAPKGSGYVPPHLRNRPAGGGGDRGGDRGGFGNFGTFCFNARRANRDDDDATDGTGTGMVEWSEEEARASWAKKMSFRGVANGWMRVGVRDPPDGRCVPHPGTHASVIFCFIRMRARFDAIGDR